MTSWPTFTASTPQPLARVALRRFAGTVRGPVIQNYTTFAGFEAGRAACVAPYQTCIGERYLVQAAGSCTHKAATGCIAWHYLLPVTERKSEENLRTYEKVRRG